MAQTLLTEVQDFCERMKLPVPPIVIGNPDPNVVQLKALLYETGNALAIHGDWSRLTFETVHTTLAQEDQGSIYTLTGGATLTPFRKIKQDTMWDRTDQCMVAPINPANWQWVKATTSVSPRYRYRLVRGRLLFTPTPPAGHTVAFEWLSKWWIQDGGTGAIKERFVLDTDSFLIERELLKLGLSWRWKKAKGFAYDDDYQEYAMRLQETLAHDVTRPTLTMDRVETTAAPTIHAPSYSWNVT